MCVSKARPLKTRHGKLLSDYILYDSKASPGKIKPQPTWTLIDSVNALSVAADNLNLNYAAIDVNVFRWKPAYY